MVIMGFIIIGFIAIAAILAFASAESVAVKSAILFAIADPDKAFAVPFNEGAIENICGLNPAIAAICGLIPCGNCGGMPPNTCEGTCMNGLGAEALPCIGCEPLGSEGAEEGSMLK